MLESRTLERWHRAGLIDDVARDRIAAYEAAHARPVWLWGLAGIGAFAIVLGLAALVAANWALIPGRVKIASHLALDAGVAAAAFAAWRAGWDRTRELLALLLFGMVLSGIGLVGQVYQLGGTTWQALAVWMAVCTPFLLLVTRSGLCGLAWCGGVLVTYGVAFPELGTLFGTGDKAVMALLWIAVLSVLGAGLLRGALPGGAGQGRWIRGLALVALLVAASLPPFLLRLQDWESGEAGLLRDGFVPGLLATVGLIPVLAFDGWRHRRWDVTASVLAAAGFGVWFACIVLGNQPGGRAQVAGALVFMAFWACVAALAARSGRRAAFGSAFGVIALRVFLLYWEVFGGLLSTGAGLLIGGAVCIALAALGWRVVQAVQPRAVR